MYRKVPHDMSGKRDFSCHQGRKALNFCTVLDGLREHDGANLKANGMQQ